MFFFQSESRNSLLIVTIMLSKSSPRANVNHVPAAALTHSLTPDASKQTATLDLAASVPFELLTPNHRPHHRILHPTAT